MTPFAVSTTPHLDETGVDTLITIRYYGSKVTHKVVMTADQAWELAAQLMVVAGRLSPESVEK